MPSIIDQKYLSLSDPHTLGGAITVEAACADGKGRFRAYQNGAIYWHPDTGAHVVLGLIFKKWAALGRERGSLGYPTSDESPTVNGRYGVFQHGVALWKSGAQEAFEVHGDIAARFQKLSAEKGVLGFPVSDERKTPDGAGRYNHFEHGSIYWHPDTGALEVRGLILQKWAALGWERSPLGYPTTGEHSTGKGTFNNFQHGIIYWTYGAASAFEVHGAIHDCYREFGAELGPPTTDGTKTPDGVGRYNHFLHGSVYWKPNLGAHAVFGPIHQHWADHGWEQNPALGYPIGDTQRTRAGSDDQFSDFENGVLYWRSYSDTVSPADSENILFVALFAGAEASLLAAVREQFLGASAKISLNSGPQKTAIHDYSHRNGRVVNRTFHVETQLNIDIPTGDATVDVALDLELWFDRSSGQLMTTLQGRRVHAHVPGITTQFVIDAKEVRERVQAPLDARLYVDTPLPKEQQLPKGAAVLSLKVMPDGTIRVYVP